MRVLVLYYGCSFCFGQQIYLEGKGEGQMKRIFSRVSYRIFGWRWETFSEKQMSV